MQKNQPTSPSQGKPLKILYLVTLSEWGGAQKYIFDLATGLKNNYRVEVAVGGDQNGQLIQKSVKLNIQTYYLKNLQRKINFYLDWLAFWNIYSLCRQVKPDIIHLNSSKAGSLGAIAAKFAGVKKIIYTVHGLVLNEPLSSPTKLFYWLSEWLSAKFKTHLICVSEFDKKSLLAHKITKPKKITVIHNGIDLNNLNFFSKPEARQKLEKIITYKLDSDSPSSIAKNYLIGTIANFYKTKGFPYLIEAAKKVKELNPNIKFIIIGDGPQRKKITELIESYQLSQNVLLLGIMEKAWQYLKAFDIFVLPSLKEGLAYTLIEAEAAGLPIITTDVGGNPEIVEHGQNGLLIPAQDFNALAENIINLHQNHLARERFIKNNLAKAQKFELRTMIDKTQQIYA